jgi:hypothetical protein
MSRVVKPLPKDRDIDLDASAAPGPLERPDELRALALAAARGDGGAAGSLLIHVGGRC